MSTILINDCRYRLALTCRNISSVYRKRRTNTLGREILPTYIRGCRSARMVSSRVLLSNSVVYQTITLPQNLIVGYNPCTSTNTDTSCRSCSPRLSECVTGESQVSSTQFPLKLCLRWSSELFGGINTSPINKTSGISSSV